MTPKYKILKKDGLQWVVTRTALSKPDKEGNQKITTREVGYFPKLGQAGVAVYHQAQRDDHPQIDVFEEFMNNSRTIDAAASSAIDVAVAAIEATQVTPTTLDSLL